MPAILDRILFSTANCTRQRRLEQRFRRIRTVQRTDTRPKAWLSKAKPRLQSPSPNHKDANMTTNAISLYTKRRTQYALGKELPISTAEAEELIRQAIRIAPSAFNSQSSRAVILFDAMHEKLWDITRETLRAIVPADAFAPTDAKMDAFAAGAGTVLFFEDQDVIRELQK